MSFIQRIQRIALLGIMLAGAVLLHSQSAQPLIQNYLQASKARFGWSDADITNWILTDQYTDRNTGLTYAYAQQTAGGIRIFNAISSIAIRDGKVVHYANRFQKNTDARINTRFPVLLPEDAVRRAAEHIGNNVAYVPTGVFREGQKWAWNFGDCGIADGPIRAYLTYLTVNDALILAWNVNIPLAQSDDWWNIRIDAQTGAFLDKNNWTVHCQFDHPTGEVCTGIFNPAHPAHKGLAHAENSAAATYSAYALPLEAPSFGDRTVFSEPNAVEASPFGWLDVDGVTGPEYTITRGNNVHAYEDRDDNNQPGYSPDGGATLNFNFPIDLGEDQFFNEDAVITNLFYMNNVIHDVLYQHGFTEVAGNFQENNYGRGGEDGDYVRAESNDGSGTNNANFSTPDDGNRPRMQMYLWDNPVTSGIKIAAPSPIAGVYTAAAAVFGPSLNTPVSGSIVLVQDSVDNSSDACQPLVNAAALAGKIALIDRSSCSFSDQIKAVNDAGALGAIVVNNLTTPPSAMGGNGTGITIPSVMIARVTGDSIKAQLAAGNEVVVTLRRNPKYDSALDNGVIAHEYGHGLSNRLTGGPSNSDCLGNREQGGEGWSDWLALILSIEPDDTGADGRGIGTYLLGESTTGEGIRRFRYSTNLAINPQVYGDVATSGVPHPIGEIWCQAIWDLTWKLIETEGFDPDWYYGTGGNNTAMRLVVEGMKLQPCEPGYIDARNAILAADELLYNGAHRCLIWEVFTRRGYGKNADQGSSDATDDQTDDFTLPNICLTPTAPPTANFTVSDPSSCRGVFQFKDLSTDIPQSYEWDFGDGNTSTDENPWHSYQTPGTYTVTLKVSNTLGEDTHTLTIQYFIDPAPSVNAVPAVCAGNGATLSANVLPGYDAIWYQNGVVVGEGAEFLTAPLSAGATFTVQQFEVAPQAKVGALDNTIGGGGFQSSGQGRLLFEAYAPFRLLSAFFYAQDAGNRTFNLYSANNAILQTKTVFIPEGAHRIALNFDIPGPGLYSIGGNGQKLYRNVTGAQFPYTVDSLVNIYSSNFGPNPTGAYFYFYDWELRYCYSEPASVTVAVTPGPIAAFTASTNGLNVSFANQTSGNPTSYNWDFGDGNTATAASPTHTYATPGFYTVRLTVSDGNCSSTFEVQVAAGVSGVNQADAQFALRIYPNPASELLFVEWEGGSGEAGVAIMDASGRVVAEQITNLRKVSIPVDGLPAGAYQLRVVTPQGTVSRIVTIAR